MLKRGDSGDAIKELQIALDRAGFDPGPLDGIFGPKTDAAVRKFQEAQGLQVDGIAGPKTMGAFEELAKKAAEKAKTAAGGVGGGLRAKFRAAGRRAKGTGKDTEKKDSGPAAL